MAGNVLEWVNDWFGYYQDVPTENPEGPSTGDTKITRGGSWFSRQNTVNAVYRSNHKDPSIAEVGATDIGFRCVRE